MTNTIKWDLDEWVAAQSSPWDAVNTAMSRIDQILQISVVDKDLTSPPGSPNEGDAYIPVATASSAWAGQENKLAVYLNGGWIFIELTTGSLIYNQANSSYYAWNGTALIAPVLGV